MSDLRILALVISGGFLFLGGIMFGGDLGLALMLLGAIPLLIPFALACFHLFRWLTTPYSDQDKESK